jgi:hypothetical protein
LAPPYPAANEIVVAGNGTWSVQCGYVERLTTNPVPEYGTIFVEVSHNVAVHDGEPAPVIDGVYMYGGVDQEWSMDPEYGPARMCTPMDPVAHGEDGHFDKTWIVRTKLAGERTWHVEVNAIHAVHEEAVKAHRRSRSGCLFPFWWGSMPTGRDHAADEFRRMQQSGEIRVVSREEAPAQTAKPKSRPRRKATKKGKKK